MKATSISPLSGQRTASSSTVVFLHGHQLERNLARADLLVAQHALRVPIASALRDRMATATGFDRTLLL